MIRIRNYKKKETNPYANPRFANNGGGYSQPVITGIFNDGAHFIIEDTSCGDFGRRIYIKVSSSRGVFKAYFGEMLQEVEQYTNFSRQNKHAERYAKAITEFFGNWYRVPKIEEFFEEEEEEELVF